MVMSVNRTISLRIVSRRGRDEVEPSALVQVAIPEESAIASKTCAMLCDAIRHHHFCFVMMGSGVRVTQAAPVFAALAAKTATAKRASAKPGCESVRAATP